MLVACDDSIAYDNGQSALIRVAGARFEEQGYPADTTAEPPPAQHSADGGIAGPPGIVSISSQNNTVKRGTISKTLRVVVDPDATTVAIAIEGDRGYWVTPVTTRSLEFAPSLELNAIFDFDRALPLGPTRLWFAAADAQGQYGPPKAQDLTIVDDAPMAPLVVALDWTQNVDLDLVIAQPDGKVLTNKAVRTAGSTADSPKIDLDSNANCVLDGHRSENAIYTAVPPGEYIVYVRLAGSCGFPETGWRVRLLRDGQTISTVNGAAYAFETALPNGGPAGPGRLALRFNIGG
ncbi:MAG: hypothetical protein JWN48_4387 [Myxococcaceae bacterium]|nr:hypothetical protein [Myxococcaceae bacterium]